MDKFEQVAHDTICMLKFGSMGGTVNSKQLQQIAAHLRAEFGGVRAPVVQVPKVPVVQVPKVPVVQVPKVPVVQVAKVPVVLSVKVGG